MILSRLPPYRACTIGAGAGVTRGTEGNESLRLGDSVTPVIQSHRGCLPEIVERVPGHVRRGAYKPPPVQAIFQALLAATTPAPLRPAVATSHSARAVAWLPPAGIWCP